MNSVRYFSDKVNLYYIKDNVLINLLKKIDNELLDYGCFRFIIKIKEKHINKISFTFVSPYDIYRYVYKDCGAGSYKKKRKFPKSYPIEDIITEQNNDKSYFYLIKKDDTYGKEWKIEYFDYLDDILHFEEYY